MISYGLIWLLIIAFALAMYIILDGFTLGIGLLFPWFKHSQQRHMMMETILPVWDGNETWLVFAGAALYAGFPLAFSILLGAYYIPGIILVIGLLFRGISLEFLHKTTRLGRVWEACFIMGSLLAIIAQGLIMSALVGGSNFTRVVTILGLISAYSGLAACRLGGRLNHSLKNKFAKISKLAQTITSLIVILSLLLLRLDNPNNALSNNSTIKVMLSILLLLSLFSGYYWLNRQQFNRQFFNLVIVSLAIYLYYVLSLLPFIVPFKLTYYQAQADDSTLKFMLIGAVIFIPLILINTRLAYRLFASGANKNETSY